MGVLTPGATSLAAQVGGPRITLQRLAIVLVAFALALAAWPWLYGFLMRGAWLVVLAPCLLCMFLLGKWPTVVAVMALLPLQFPMYASVGADPWRAVVFHGGWAWPVACSLIFYVLGQRQDDAASWEQQHDRLASLQARLEESESRFRRLTEAANEGIVVHDKGRILDVNPAMVGMSGWSREELIGQQVMSITAPESVESVLANIRAGMTDPYEMTGLTKGGGRILLEVEGKSLPWEGRELRVTLIRDVTWRKQAEESLRQANEKLEATVYKRTADLQATNTRLEEAIEERDQAEQRAIQAQKLESLGLLAGGIAHDFNNLLAAMIGRLELAAGTLSEGAEAADHVKRATTVATRAAELVNLLLAYSGRAPTMREQADMGDLASEVADIARLAFPKKAALEVSSAEGPLPVVVDSGQARQVVLNLLTNAGEALVDGAGLVTMSVEEAPFGAEERAACIVAAATVSARWVRVRVCDDGVGMDDETVARMFDPFFTTKETGHGLGLSAVIGIVRAHGSGLAVESAPGAGTAVSWWLPADESGPVEQVVEGAAAPRAAGARGLVLVVDDEDVVRELVAEILESDGWDVVSAADGEEALVLQAAHAERLRGVVLDVSMPVMDGAETLAALRERAPGLPVLLMSGYSAAETRQRFEQLGAPPILHKPFKLPALLSAVAEMVQEAQQG